MATDMSVKADGSIWPTGQGTDAVSSPEHAMTAPGSVPAQAVDPSRADPDPAAVTPSRCDGRRLSHGDPGGQAEGRWEDVSGRRGAWGPS